MTIDKFEDIIAWQKAQDSTVQIYSCFGTMKDWDFRNQICRAAVSISNNIAEGYSRKYTSEFKRFLQISTSSCSEVGSMLYLAQRLGYLNKKNTSVLLEQSEEISRIIRGFIKYLDNQPKKKPTPTKN